jgi:CBS domain-containing protein
MSLDVYGYLAKMPHFALLPDRERKRIAEDTQIKTCAKGHVLAIQDKTVVDQIFIVYSGQLSLHSERQGIRQLSGYDKSGDVFGGISILMNGGIALRSAIADTDSVLLVVPKEIFLDLCTRYKSFYEYFIANFSKHLSDESLTTIIETGQARLFLANLEPFSFLPEEEIDRISGELSMVKYPKDTVLFVQGMSRVGYLYILQRGLAERYFERSNQKTMSDILSDGDIYGGISMLLNDGMAVRSMRVTEDSYFYILSKDSFIDLCERFEAFSEFFTDTFGKRMLDKSYAAIIAKTLHSEAEDLQFFNQTVASITNRKILFGDASLSIQQAAKAMDREKSSFILIKSQDGHCRGIVTERDLTRKVIATGYDASQPIADIMSAPLLKIPDQALVFEALMSMLDHDLRHLAVTDSSGKVVGILSNREFLIAQGQSPLFLLREISAANNISEIVLSHGQLPRLIRTLITSGANAKNVNRFITTVSDAILQKVMEFTLAEMPQPPAKFVFMILGSEGRSEQTLKTDQDNAIVYENPDPQAAEVVQEYFLKFAERANTLLDQAGYAFCTGNVMARNPKWCQPLSVWKEYFSTWIHAAGPEDLLQASIFFDFRKGYGEDGLIDELRDFLFQSLGGWTGFFRNLTENALNFRPPLGFFRNFVVESKGKHRNAFDIKSAMTPIVDFARIYALKHKIGEINTLDRLHQLYQRQVLNYQEYEELDKGYSFLMQLRFARQVTAALDEKVKPDNYINPKKLTRIEQTTLKEIFKRIEKIQTKMSFDFLGMA